MAVRHSAHVSQSSVAASVAAIYETFLSLRQGERDG